MCLVPLAHEDGLRAPIKVRSRAAALATASVSLITFVLTAPICLAEDEAGSLQEIVVTATKRTELLRNVPESIAVLSGDALREGFVASYEDLSHVVPDLAFNNTGGNKGLSLLEIRGVSSTAGAGTVAIYLDDVPATVHDNPTLQGSVEPNFLDIDRVEVLRGPQGTLYGASAMGGAIRFISRRPELDKFEGSAASELSGTDFGGFNDRETLVANLPLVSGAAALRSAIEFSQQSGYVDQTGITGGIGKQDHTNSERDITTRITLRVDPGSNWSILAGLFYQNVKNDDTPTFDLDQPRFHKSSFILEGDTDKLVIPSLTITGQLGFANFTAVSSYFSRKTNTLQDATNYDVGYIGPLLNAPPPSGYGYGGDQIAQLATTGYDSEYNDQFSQEIRFASTDLGEGDSASRLSWVAGLYYSQLRIHSVFIEQAPGFNALFTSLYGVAPIDSPYFGVAAPNDLLADAEDRETDTEYAGFGDFDYRVTEALKLSVGLRYESATVNDQSVAQPVYFGSGTNSVQVNQNSTRSYPLTPKFAANYTVNNQLSVYANIGRGFRLGGINEPIVGSILQQCGGDLQAIGVKTPPRFYGPDSLWSYEVGEKAQLLDHRLSIDSAAYYIRWSGIQQTIYLPTCGQQFTANAGQAESYGTELEIRGQVATPLTLLFGGAWTHARLVESSPDAGASPGQRLLAVPDWSLNIGAEVSQPFADEWYGFGRITSNWTGPSRGSYDETSVEFYRPSYNLLNLSFGVDRGPWHAEAFAKNLLNENKVIQTINIDSNIRGYAPRPRTIGIRAAWKF